MINMNAAGKAVLFLVCVSLGFFSGARHADAHEIEGHDADSVTAGEVTDRESMKKFVLHAKAHFESISGVGENSLFKQQLKIDGGSWKDGTTYLIRIAETGEVIDHPHFPSAETGNLYDLEDSDGKKVLRELIKAAGASGEGGCVAYSWDDPSDDSDDPSRVSCAVRSRSFGDVDYILIAGLHHDLEDADFSRVKCPYYSPEISANEVADRDTLKKFVKGFIEYVDEQRELLGIRDFLKIQSCWRILPWKYGPIYTFIMTEQTQSVFFNGNTPHLEDSRLNVTDDDGVNVGDLIVSEVRDPEGDGFVEYLWDDPTDDVPPVTEEGRSPGNVPKVSYVERVQYPRGEAFIYGSGYYPHHHEEKAEDDGGCALGGTADASRGALFSLLLAASALFLAALRKNRPGAKRVTRRFG